MALLDNSLSRPLLLRLFPSPFLLPPAKNPIPHTPSVILHPPPAKPISTISPKSSNSSPLQKYTYPDPIPEFAKCETQKFRTELLKRLSEERETFGEELDRVVEVCSEIFSNFLHKEYGGPGTLLVEPFTVMFIALKEQKLPGAPLAARTSLLWAQNYVDQDWEAWNSNLPIDFH